MRADHHELYANDQKKRIFGVDKPWRRQGVLHSDIDILQVASGILYDVGFGSMTCCVFVVRTEVWIRGDPKSSSPTLLNSFWRVNRRLVYLCRRDGAALPTVRPFSVLAADRDNYTVVPETPAEVGRVMALATVEHQRSPAEYPLVSMDRTERAHPRRYRTAIRVRRQH